MIIWVKGNKISIQHEGRTYCWKEAMEVIKKEGTDEDLQQAEYIESICIIKK